MDRADIAGLETQAYRARWDDGLFDLFFGLSLVWIGVAWVWIEPMAALAGVLPAVMVVPFISFRTRFIEARAGYVKFSEERRSWERRNLTMLLIVGSLTLILAVGAFLVLGDGEGFSSVVDTASPGLICFLLALAVLIVAVVSMLPRLFMYTGALAAGGMAAVVADANPGAPLIPVGILVVVCGVALLVRFMTHHPSHGVAAGQ